MVSAIARGTGRIGRAALAPVVAITSIAHLIGATVAAAWGQRLASQGLVIRETVRQVRATGVRTLPSVLQMGLLVGLIAATQMISLLAGFTGTTKVWGILVLIIFREVAPLVTAIIVAGRAGTVVAADLANMVVSEEMDALETMGISPLHYAVLPRMLGLFLASSALSFYFVAAALAGAAAVARLSLSLPFTFFINNILQNLETRDLAIFVSKAAVFALLISSVCAWKGLTVGRSRQEVPLAVSRATFQSLAACLVANSLFSLFIYLRPSHLYALFG
jgi:phospholipid/cholesterol/gamma-HCH transport system permease protein